MTDRPEAQDAPKSSGVSRRTVMKGVAWAAPVIAVSAKVPMAAASGKLPCIGDIAATGGTYPVTVPLGGCNDSGGHWDFNFTIKAAAKGDDCDCDFVRVTFYDNPDRQSQLWLNQSSPRPQRYVQKVLAAGASAVFPTTGDKVYNVSDNSFVGTITSPGSENDALHTAYFAGGSPIPCDGDGPMATYKVECGTSASGPWTQLGGIGTINPCIPMIQSTVCSNSNGSYTLGVSVLQSCGLSASQFQITSVRRSTDANDPLSGTVVWSTGTSLTGGSATITTSTSGSGSNLWIAFTTDGVNTSRIRISTSNANDCGAACVPVIVSKCRTGNSSNRIYKLGLKAPSSCGQTITVTKISTSAGSGGTTLVSGTWTLNSSSTTTITTTTPTNSSNDVYIHYKVGSGSDQSLEVTGSIGSC